ncbi:DUF4082 domain-containing protein [Leifsonia sp. NPDC058230]|uniref:DUF4082 domain-containing protein n=1 Tax=Leifsonia sp. NPDC058230 TaxID=3346391 RepID=UPI0036D79BF0
MATAGLMVIILVTWLLMAVAPSASAAGGCGTAPNPIVCENALPGTDPSVWDINGAGDSDIQGYSTDISVNVGSTISFKVDTTARAYTIQIFRTGYYQGLGARKIADVTPSATLPQVQPQCLWDATTELTDCGNWGVSASWNVPTDVVSGVYLALLTRTDNGDSSHITFVVRNDSSHSAVLFQTSDPTWEAYNTYGGSDFYQGAANGRAYKISYNRPMVTRGNNDGRDFYFSNEYPMVRFLEKNGYDVSYFSGVDTDRYGSKLLNHKVFLSVGHDEYWSAAQRANVTAARDAGVNLQFLSGNEMYWHTRYEPSVAGTPTNYRTLVSYKETWANAKIDPTAQWTGTWRDPRFASQANGAGLPENGLTGTMYMSNFSDLAVTVNSAQGKTRMWRNTSLTSMAPGATTALAPSTVGYESNEDIDNGFRPAGLIDLSTTVGPVPQYLQDFGNETEPGTTTHHVTLYRAPSGALVFSAGTIQWAWGLDQNHDGDGPPADVRMQQAQVNLLADMGAQPATLASGLVASAASTDRTAPVAVITSPAAGASIANGASVTVTGTATDSGGVVAGVEVSTDGTTWHPATGTTAWTYTYSQQGVGAQTLRVRATDDSGNYPSTPTSRAVTVTGPYSAFGSIVPATPDAGDTSSVELGLKFTPSQSGYVSGVRFFKSAANTGVHTGSLWDSNGTRLANVTFANETASGWQTAAFTSVVPVAAGVTYTVSYSAPNGHYAATQFYWSYRGLTFAPLTVAGGFGATPAGVYNTAIGQYPSSSFAQSNYFVDAVFTTTDNSPLQATGQFPIAGSSSVPRSSTVGATFSKPVVPSSVSITLKNPTGSTVAGSVSYNATTRVATFTPTSALSASTVYSVTMAATDTSGFTLTSGQTWSFTTVNPDPAPGVCPCGLFTDSTVPTTLQVADNPVTLGVTFSSSVDGTVSGMRFYKGTGNTGTHVGALWSAAGAQLATATFTNESTSGWQTVTFSSPVAITANAKYVVSYRTTTGFYSTVAGQYSGSGITNSPLSAGTGAGAFSYSDSFPDGSSTTNYMVDVIFNRANASITASNLTPANGATGVATSSTISLQLSAPVVAGYNVAVSSGGSPVAGTTYLSADAKTISFVPSPALPAGAVVNVSVTGVKSSQGAVLPTQNWSFTTHTAAAPVTYSLFGLENPVTPAATTDSSSVELGASFTTSQSGTVNAIRFYKGTTNTGTHTGSLWSSTGTRLATVTFTNETASGWQTAQLATPVAITAGQTYVVSYLAPNGNYSFTSNYFATAKTSGPLTAGTVNNGRFVYGSGGTMPNGTWNATNYFVDVVFTPSTTPPPAPVSVTSTAPASGATNVAPTVTVTATLSADPGSTPALALSGPGGSIAGTSSYNATTKVVSFTPTTPLPWSTAITASVTAPGATITGGSWSFTTTAAPPTVDVDSIFAANAVPDVPGWGDSNEIQVGVRFTTSVAGTITGIRFYKGVENTGVHQGYLWSATGQQLAAVTFANETASGWQTATFSQPIAIVPGVEYRASYHSNVGWYSVTSGGLANVVTNGPLSTFAPGGVYQYGGDFPSNPTTTNFWIDVAFKPNP